jgi:MarR family transcriptional regulator, organic hydroperoxide resistance regulator
MHISGVYFGHPKTGCGLGKARLRNWPGEVKDGFFPALFAMKQTFALADFVPYLLNRAGVQVGLDFARAIATLGVTVPMWRVMALLWESGDQRLGEIAEGTSIDISTLSRLLLTLQRKQFIVRKRSGTDGRALSVSLTKKGRAMTERIIPIAMRCEDVAIRGIRSNDLRRLKQLLTTVFTNLKMLDEELASQHKTEKRKKAQRK